jgi:hypothetical protein
MSSRWIPLVHHLIHYHPVLSAISWGILTPETTQIYLKV